MDIQLKKGILEICVLRSLQEKDSYGYKMIQDISPYITISESTLYPILKRLEKGGYLITYSKEYNGRLRKYYQITSVGKKKIEEFKEEYIDIKKVYDYILKEEEDE